MKMEVESLVFRAQPHFRIFCRIAPFSILSCKKMLYIDDQIFPDIQKQQFTVENAPECIKSRKLKPPPLYYQICPCAANGISVLLPKSIGTLLQSSGWTSAIVEADIA